MKKIKFDEQEILDGVYIKLEDIDLDKKDTQVKWELRITNAPRTIQCIINDYIEALKYCESENKATRKLHSDDLDDIIRSNIPTRDKIGDLEEFIGFLEEVLTEQKYEKEEFSKYFKDIQKKLKTATDMQVNTIDENITRITKCIEKAKQELEKLQKQLQEELKNDN